MALHRRALPSAIGFLLLPLALVAQAPTQQAKPSSASVRAQIEAVNKQFVALFNKGDAEGFAKVYATDATILPPNAQPIHGREAITKFWRGGWDAGLRNVVLTTTEVSAMGNTAYEVGTAQLEMRKPDGSLAGKDTGKYIVIWKRDAGGNWQWYRDIWNSNLPATTGK
jgi:uncharacterized protein (TIGR02246 family)